MAAEVMKEMTQHTLGLIRIKGQLVETRDPTLFREAKTIAHKMSRVLGLCEVPENLKPISERNLLKTTRKYIISVGRIAKACEAWDHFEDFPYRKTLEKEVRSILLL